MYIHHGIPTSAAPPTLVTVETVAALIALRRHPTHEPSKGGMKPLLFRWYGITSFLPHYRPPPDGAGTC